MEILGSDNPNKQVRYNPKQDKKTLFSLGGMVLLGLGLVVFVLGLQDDNYIIFYAGAVIVLLGLVSEIWSFLK